MGDLMAGFGHIDDHVHSDLAAAVALLVVVGKSGDRWPERGKNEREADEGNFGFHKNGLRHLVDLAQGDARARCWAMICASYVAGRESRSRTESWWAAFRLKAPTVGKIAASVVSPPQMVLLEMAAPVWSKIVRTGWFRTVLRGE